MTASPCQSGHWLCSQGNSAVICQLAQHSTEQPGLVEIATYKSTHLGSLQTQTAMKSGCSPETFAAGNELPQSSGPGVTNWLQTGWIWGGSAERRSEQPIFIWRMKRGEQEQEQRSAGEWGCWRFNSGCIKLLLLQLQKKPTWQIKSRHAIYL